MSGKNLPPLWESASKIKWISKQQMSSRCLCGSPSSPLARSQFNCTVGGAFLGKKRHSWLKLSSVILKVSLSYLFFI